MSRCCFRRRWGTSWPNHRARQIGGNWRWSCHIGGRRAGVLSRDVICVDCLREVPAAFSPEVAVAELSALLKSYSIRSVTGDKYAGEWPREAFSRHNISYEQSSLVKSQLYSAFLPQLNSGKVELLDSARLINQLCQLERRTARGGRDSIDHPPGASYHDDLANCVAGLCSVGTSSAASYARALKRLYEANTAPMPMRMSCPNGFIWIRQKRSTRRS